MLLKYGDLLVSLEKPYSITDDEVERRYPVKIAFSKLLDEDDLLLLATCAFLIEKGKIADKLGIEPKDG